LPLHDRVYKFRALTIIDMVTILVEVVRIENKSSATVAFHFENTWLAQYPRPLSCSIHDTGTEFTGADFKSMLARHGIRDKVMSAKNPQANAVCEQMHQSAIGNTLRRVLQSMENPPEGIVRGRDMVDTAIANAMYAARGCT
jgi:transposase InsO family protein